MRFEVEQCRITNPTVLENNGKIFKKTIWIKQDLDFEFKQIFFNSMTSPNKFKNIHNQYDFPVRYNINRSFSQSF